LFKRVEDVESAGAMGIRARDPEVWGRCWVSMHGGAGRAPAREEARLGPECGGLGVAGGRRDGGGVGWWGGCVGEVGEREWGWGWV